MSKDIRFELEDSITSCWGVTTDLYDLLEEVIEGEPTTDQISNVLLGMHELYEIRFRKLFRTFEQALKQGAFRKTEEPISFDQFLIDAGLKEVWDEAYPEKLTEQEKVEIYTDKIGSAPDLSSKARKKSTKKTSTKRSSKK